MLRGANTNYFHDVCFNLRVIVNDRCLEHNYFIENMTLELSLIVFKLLGNFLLMGGTATVFIKMRQ